MRRSFVLLALATIGGGGCGALTETPTAPSALASASSAAAPKRPTLAVLPADFDFSRNPSSMNRVADSPHRYYRFIAEPFAAVVCDRYAGLAEGAPVVEIHGDAHLEQYMVGSPGRGLSDLDRHARGPAIMDLLRMATSIVLAVDETVDDAALRGAAPKGIAALFRGYRTAIDDPDKRLEAPAIVARIARKKNDRKALLAFADTAMKPADGGAKSRGQALYGAFQSEMLQRNGERPKDQGFPESFFTMERLGTLELGIGSVLDERFLLRLAGETSSADDDVIVELKPVRAPSASCLAPSADYAEERFLFAEPPAPLRCEPGPIPGTGYWSIQWSDDYHELRIDKTLVTSDDLAAIAFESGFLLGRGHLLSVTAGTRDAAKLALRPSADLEARVAEAAVELAQETERAWQTFKAALEPAPAGTGAPP